MASAGTDRGRVALRAFRPDDAPAVRALVEPEIERLGYREASRSALDAAIAAAGPESCGLVAVDAGQVTGALIHGTVAGAIDTGRLQLVVVAPEARRRGLAVRLIEDAIAAMADAGARVIFVEVPDEPALVAGLRLLLKCGFSVDARVPDYFRDGVDLAILRRDIGAVDAHHQPPRSISS